MNVCDQFAENIIDLKELGHSICAHGSALENLGPEWEDFIACFDSECEIIEMENLPKKYHEKGMILISKLKNILNEKNA